MPKKNNIISNVDASRLCDMLNEVSYRAKDLLEAAGFSNKASLEFRNLVITIHNSIIEKKITIEHLALKAHWFDFIVPLTDFIFNDSQKRQYFITVLSDYFDHCYHEYTKIGPLVEIHTYKK